MQPECRHGRRQWRRAGRRVWLWCGGSITASHALSLEGTCTHLLSQEAACAGGKAVRHSGPGRWRAARTEALTSAKVRVVLTLEKQLSSDTSLQIRCCVCRALQPSAAYLRWPAAS